MAETWWSIRWKNGDDSLAAIGVRNDRMPVYRENGARLRRTKMSFPSCLRFMPYAEIVEDWHRVSRRETQARISDPDR